MIIDSFLYHNEIELLELRLKVLYDYVDKFIIVEGDHTFKGDFKSFRCKKDLISLGFDNDPKIHLIEVNLEPCEGNTSHDEEMNYWHTLRNAQISLFNDDDIFIVADIDELWYPQSIEPWVNYLNDFPDVLFVNSLYDLQYNINYALSAYGDSPNICMHPPVAKKSFWKKHKPQNVRHAVSKGGHVDSFPYKIHTMNNENELVNIYKKGWHLSWMGDSNKRLDKINSHSWYMESNEWREKIKSNDVLNNINNFNPNNQKGDLLGRINEQTNDIIHLINFNPEELINIIDKIGNMSHVKDFLYGNTK